MVEMVLSIGSVYGLFLGGGLDTEPTFGLGLLLPAGFWTDAFGFRALSGCFTGRDLVVWPGLVGLELTGLLAVEGVVITTLVLGEMSVLESVFGVERVFKPGATLDAAG